MISTDKPAETAILVGVARQDQNTDKTKEYLEELAFLAETSGAITKKTFYQNLTRPDVKTYIGKGKLEEIVTYAKAEEIDIVIFDDDLSASQVRNIEAVLNEGVNTEIEPGIKVLDRSLLILDIFSIRAQTSQARTQVTLAQYEYLLPRLTRMWTHLSKQKGGIGMKGPGETELETDRRIIRDKISLLKKKLEKIDSQAITKRKGRNQLVRVALVGYTNVGKSTLMRRMSKADAFAEDKLFATLDALVRKVVIGNMPFLLTDTVGFIRKLPHTLVECFKSTLDEIREADYLIHVVDISHPNYGDHISVVKQTLSEIGAADIPMMTVYNKIDSVQMEEPIQEEKKEVDDDEDWVVPMSERENIVLETPRTFMDQDFVNAVNYENGQPSIYISATHKKNLELLRETLFQEIKKIHVSMYPNYLQGGFQYF